MRWEVAIYWGSYLLWPLLGVLVFLVLTSRWWQRLVCLCLMVPVALGIYARFVEPRRLLMPLTEVEICGRGLPGTLNLAVISDLHEGIFPNAHSVDGLVKAINYADPDLTLIAGDLTYDLAPGKFDKAFAGFRDLNAPAYAVLGNHDHEHGEGYAEALKASLGRQGVRVLAPDSEIFRKHGKIVRIVGMRDLKYAWHNKLPLGEGVPEDDVPVIAIAHNPNTVKQRHLPRYDLMVSGHTHGGQILLPRLTCKMTGACNTLIYGLGDAPGGKLFVTAGTGMVDLPMRFRAPPRVDLLKVTINRCESRPYIRNLNMHPL